MIKKIIKNYRKNFLNLIDSIKVTDEQRKKINFYRGIEITCNIIKVQSKQGGKIFFIGNGGSAAVASHMATDFLKNASLPAMTFNDPSLITCFSNDFGYEHVFQKPLEMFSRGSDILFSISSSGQSKNILNASKKAKDKRCSLITLTGFSSRNPLRQMGDINFYVPSCEYGFVEVIHHYICHCIVDTIVKKRN